MLAESWEGVLDVGDVNFLCVVCHVVGKFDDFCKIAKLTKFPPIQYVMCWVATLYVCIYVSSSIAGLSLLILQSESTFEKWS